MVVRNVDSRIKYSEEQSDSITSKLFTNELDKMKSFIVNDERYSVVDLPAPTFYKERTLETVDGNPPIVVQFKQVGKYRILVLNMNPRFNFTFSYFKQDGVENVIFAQGCGINVTNDNWSLIGVNRNNMNIRQYGVIILETT